MMAGLLACGSPPAPSLPSFPVALRGHKLAAYSCGYSQGFARTERTLFPFRPSLEGTITARIIVQNAAVRNRTNLF